MSVRPKKRPYLPTLRPLQRGSRYPTREGGGTQARAWSQGSVRHAFFAKRRVVEVLLRPCALISRKDPRFEGYGATAMVDAFEESLVKYVAASAAWR